MNKPLHIFLCSVFILCFSIAAQAQTGFTKGGTQSLYLCENAAAINIDTFLTANYPSGSTITWDVSIAPANGSLAGFPDTASSTGSPVTPTGLTYVPNTGYSGSDVIKIGVTINGITYSFTTINVTVYPTPDAGTITGPATVCTGSAITLTDATTGGAWSSSNTSATVSGGMVTGVTAGTDTISYSVTNACGGAVTTHIITVNATPGPITGNKNVCVGATTALSDSVSGGSWTSSNTGIATIDPVTGIATGVSNGTTIIFYTSGGGCVASASLSAHIIPATITGSSTVCQGAQTVLLDGTSLGSWSSSDVSVATVAPFVGLVTGTGAGSVTITYTVTGCSATKTLTVYPTSPITGPATVCTGITTVLSDTLAGGTWTSGNTTLASVTSGTGVVGGLMAGVDTISYKLATGCIVTRSETVTTSPAAIPGPGIVCLGATTTLSDPTPGGAWSSDNTTVATVGSGTGIVSGIVPGTAHITYTLSINGCIATQAFSVDVLPRIDTVTGGGNYCAGGTGAHIYLDTSSTGITYYLKAGRSVISSVFGTGAPLDFGLETIADTYIVTATNTTTGCSSLMYDSAVVSITPVAVPSVTISAARGDTVCAGAIAAFTATIVNGGPTPYYQWSVNGTAVGIDTNTYSYGPANGDVVTATLVSDTVCAIPDTVTDTMTMMVVPHQKPLVSFSVYPGNPVCQGTAVMLTPIPVYGGPSPFYNYIENGVISGSGATYTYIPQNGDTVFCVMVSDYFCLSAKTGVAKIGIIVDTPVVPNLVINNYPPELTGNGISDTLIASVTNTSEPLVYQWVIDTTIITTSTSDTLIRDNFSYTNPDSVTCYVTSSGPCKVTTYSWVFVADNIGVKKVNEAISDIYVLPNPNKGEFTVKGTLGVNTDEAVALSITDMLGQVVYNNTTMARNGDINEHISLSGSLPNGMYLLCIRTETVNKVFHIVIEQ